MKIEVNEDLKKLMDSTNVIATPIAETPTTVEKTKKISAAKQVQHTIALFENDLTAEQKNKFFDREFMSKHTGISMELFISTENENKRYVNGHPRYMKKPIMFMNQPWYMTNDIHKSSVERFKNLMIYFKTTGDINPPEPVRKKTVRKSKTQQKA